MKPPRRGMIVDLKLEPVKGSETGRVRPCVIVTNDTYNERVPVVQVTPITAWSERKGQIVTNVVIEPSRKNGLKKRSVADCLQTRPVDLAKRFVRARGRLEPDELSAVDAALRTVFAL